MDKCDHACRPLPFKDGVTFSLFSVCLHVHSHPYFFSASSNLPPLPQSVCPVRRGDWHVVSAQQGVQDHRRYQSHAALSHEVRPALRELHSGGMSPLPPRFLRACLSLVFGWRTTGTGKNSGIVADRMWNVPFGWEEAAAWSQTKHFFKISLRPLTILQGSFSLRLFMFDYFSYYFNTLMACLYWD